MPAWRLVPSAALRMTISCRIHSHATAALDSPQSSYSVAHHRDFSTPSSTSGMTHSEQPDHRRAENGNGRSEWDLRRRASAREDHLAAEDRGVDLEVEEGFRLDVEGIGGEDGEVGQLAGHDRALEMILVGPARRPDGEHLQRLFHRDGLLGVVDVAALSAARYGTGDVEQRRDAVRHRAGRVT